MKKVYFAIAMILFVYILSFLQSCGGGFGSDTSNADDIGNEIFGTDSGK
jgi:hypothetical protein